MSASFATDIDPTGKFAYAANAGVNTAVAFTIDQATGALSNPRAESTGTDPVAITTVRTLQ